MAYSRLSPLFRAQGMLELVAPLVVVGLALWIWRGSLRAREAAISACHRACGAEGVQLLDQTVALKRLRPIISRGRLRVHRVYGFEFSRTGTDRVEASVSMVDFALVALHLPSCQPPSASQPVPSSDELETQHPRLH